MWSYEETDTAREEDTQLRARPEKRLWGGAARRAEERSASEGGSKSGKPSRRKSGQWLIRVQHRMTMLPTNLSRVLTIVRHTNVRKCLVRRSVR